MKITLSIAILLQVILAVVSHGLTRSIAELTAFLLAVVLAYWIKYPAALRSDSPTKSTSAKQEML